MTKNFLRLLSVLSMLLIVVSAASAGSEALVVNIPFDFRLGDTPLSSGSYIISLSGANQVLKITSQDRSEKAISLSIPGPAPRNRTKSFLVFSRYGDINFLSEVYWGDSGTLRQVLKSDTEIEVGKTTPAVRVIASSNR